MAKNFYGTPGGSLVNANLEAGDVGIQGEKRLAKSLRTWADRNDAIVFCSAQIPGKQFDADFFVLKGSLLVHVDAKLWKSGRYRFTGTEQGAEAYRIIKGSSDDTYSNFAGSTLSVNWENSTWEEYLNTNIVGVLAIQGLKEGEYFIDYPVEFTITPADRIWQALDEVVRIHNSAANSAHDQGIFDALVACTEASTIDTSADGDGWEARNLVRELQRRGEDVPELLLAKANPNEPWAQKLIAEEAVRAKKTEEFRAKQAEVNATFLGKLSQWGFVRVPAFLMQVYATVVLALQFFHVLPSPTGATTFYQPAIDKYFSGYLIWPFVFVGLVWALGLRTSQWGHKRSPALNVTSYILLGIQFALAGVWGILHIV